MTGAPERATPVGSASELWLDELGKLTSLVLHDLRNGLQAIGINIEVIRSRSQKTGDSLPASEIGGFANNASRQFEDVTRRVEALASLCKNPRAHSDVVPILEGLSNALKSAQKEPLRFTKPTGGEAPVATDVVATRMILTHVVLSAVRSGAIIEGEVRNVVPVAVHFRCKPGCGESLAEEVIRAAESLQVRIDSRDEEIVVTFPTTLRSDSVFV